MTQQIPERIPGGAVDLSHLAAAAQSRAGTPGAPVTGAGAPSGSAGGQRVDVPSLVLDLTDAAFEQAVQLSGIVPVVISLWQQGNPACEAINATLEKLTVEFGGQVMLAKVDVDANPGLANAFQVQAIPTIMALVTGRPVPLFQGAAPEEQVRDLLGQLTQLAAQQGVTGRVNAPELADGGVGDAPAEAPVNPAHEDALAAVDRGDFAGAIAAYEQVLLKAPADQEARAALVQVKLLHRLDGATTEQIRQAAAADPDDVDAQMRVADLDVSGGHVEDAFLRLLELFAAQHDADARTQIRERLLELFEVVGSTDPRVAPARARLANLLY